MKRSAGVALVVIGLALVVVFAGGDHRSLLGIAAGALMIGVGALRVARGRRPPP